MSRLQERGEAGSLVEEDSKASPVSIEVVREREAVERTRIEMERTVETLEIKRRESVQLEDQAREIAVSIKSKERSEAQA